jgi:phage shock protein PspC (stress-responsive transcriptional regulator)
MSETQHDRTAGPGAPSGDWWNRRPYRSTNDRKIAGVAGGLGRAFGVDPVLIRVGFVIATIFGGFGLLLYVLGWLLLPADGIAMASLCRTGWQVRSASIAAHARCRCRSGPLSADAPVLVAACALEAGTKQLGFVSCDGSPMKSAAEFGLRARLGWTGFG